MPLPLSRLYSLPALLLLSGIVLLPFLGIVPIYEVSEGREGVVIYEMISSHNFILPLRNGELVPSKPMLYHWFAAIGVFLFGSLNEFTLRLPSAIAAIGCLVSMYIFISQILKPSLALLGSTLLLTTAGFYNLSLDGRVDMLFCLFFTVSIHLWLQALFRYHSPEAIPERVFAWIGVLSGLSVLTKGPLGIVLPALLLFIFTFKYCGLSSTRKLLRPGLLLSFLLPLPWYVASSLQGGDGFIKRQLIFENFSRFLGGAGITKKPLWYYVEHFWDFALPWSVILLCFFLTYLLKKRKHLLTSFNDNEKFILHTGLLWFVTCFCFLSLSSGKRSSYLLLLLPAVSQILVVLIPHLQKFLPPTKKQFLSGIILWVFFLLLCTFFVVISLHLPFSFENKDLQITLLAASEVLKKNVFLFLPYIVLFGFGSLWGWIEGYKKRDLTLSVVSVFFLFIFFLTVALTVANQTKGFTHTYREFSTTLSTLVTPDQQLYFVKKKLDESFDGLFFYLKRHVTMIEPDTLPSKAGLYVARRGWIKMQPESLQAHIQEIAVGGRLIDTEDEKLVLFELQL